MSETKNLKLFKHDEPLSTNQNPFDIDKALHQNWDKIEEYVDANNQNIQNLQKQNTDLQQENTELQEENTLLKSQIPNGQAEGENITLTDSSNLPYEKFYIGGKSVQETRSGKNLLNITDDLSTYLPLTINDLTMSLNSDGTFQVKGTNQTSGFTSFSFNTEKTILKAGISYISAMTMPLYKVSNNSFVGNQKIITPEEDLYFLSCYWTTNEQREYNDTIMPMLVIGNTLPVEYEQYGVSPSPEYPSEIKSVGDDVNLVNGLKKGIYDASTGEYKNNEKYTCSNNSIQVEKNSKYVLSIDGIISNGYVYEYNSTGYIGRITTENGIYTSSNNVEYINVIFKDGTIEKVPLDSKVKLQKGTKATAYSEYGKGAIRIKQKGKNIFDKNNNTVTNGNSKTILETGIRAVMTSDGQYKYIGIELGGSELLGKEITIGATINPSSNNEGSVKTYYGNSNGVVVSTGIKLVGTGVQYITTTIADTFPDNCDRVWLLLYGNHEGTGNVNDYVDYTDLMVVLGNTLGDYEEYKGNDYVLPISETLRSLPNGVRDTIEEDGIHRRVGSVVLDGSDDENWAISGKTFYSDYIKDYKRGDIVPISNYFVGVNSKSGAGNMLIDKTIAFGSASVPADRLYIKYDSIENVTEFKAWLQSNPIQVDYEFEEEVIEPYEDNPLQKATSYKNITHIFSTDEVSPVFDITYKKDLETLFNNLNSALVQGGV